MAPGPRITIVTPSLNQGGFLGRAIESVLSQAYGNLEYVVVDGGSADESAQVLRRYADRLTRWVSEPDRGQADALTKGFAWATGDILGWLNADDLLLPGALHTVAARFAASPDVQMLYGDIVVVDEHGRFLGIVEQIPVRFETLLYGRHILNQEAVFWRRSLFDRAGGLDPGLHYALDFDLWLRMTQLTVPRHVPALLSAFRVHRHQKTRCMAAYWRELEGARARMRARLGQGRPAFSLRSGGWRAVEALRRLRRGGRAIGEPPPADASLDDVQRLAWQFGAVWLRGHHGDGWLAPAATLALPSARSPRRLRVRYRTHALPVDGGLDVGLWAKAGSRWSPLGQGRASVRGPEGAVEIEIPPADSPVTVADLAFERSCRLAARSMASLRGADFRRVAVQILGLDVRDGGGAAAWQRRHAAWLPAPRTHADQPPVSGRALASAGCPPSSPATRPSTSP